MPPAVRRRLCHHPRNPRDVSDGRYEMGSVNLSDQPITPREERFEGSEEVLDVPSFLRDE